MSALVVKFKAEHIDRIKQQQHDVIELKSINYETYKACELLQDQYSIIIKDRVVACVGLVPYWNGRGEAWAIIDRESGKNFVSVVRALKRLIARIDCNRIEATVLRNFNQAHRLVKLLGFELEAECMRKYGVTGLDYSLYARVK